MHATAPRAAGPRSQTAPIGTGALHKALEDSRDASRLHDFCALHKCTADQVSLDGVRLNMLKVFDLMRRQGYQVSEPIRPQQQMRKGSTLWHVTVVLPAGPSVRMAFHTPDQP